MKPLISFVLKLHLFTKKTFVLVYLKTIIPIKRKRLGSLNLLAWFRTGVVDQTGHKSEVGGKKSLN